MTSEPADLVMFDLDGTLVDSDAALVGAFVAHGVPEESVTFGHVLADECSRLGIALDSYLDAYDPALVRAFPGIPELLEAIEEAGSRWAICSNKHPRSGHEELHRLGWAPEAAWFSDAFGGGPKQLRGPLTELGVDPECVVYVGDTDHDRQVAAEVGCRFVLAGWNPRVEARPGEWVARHPAELLELLVLDRR